MPDRSCSSSSRWQPGPASGPATPSPGARTTSRLPPSTGRPGPGRSPGWWRICSRIRRSDICSSPDACKIALPTSALTPCAFSSNAFASGGSLHPRRSLFVGILSVALLSAASARADRREFIPPRTARTMVVADSIAATSKVAQGNKVGVTLTNWGFFGNNFTSRDASLEYPLGSGIEHLARAGLWIGASARDSLGIFTGVTSAVHDASIGFPTDPGSEFTPAGKTIVERSKDPASPFYSPAAVSAHDYITTYSDRPAGFTIHNNEDHRPLNVLVRQEVYTWPYSDMDDIVFIRFRIINLGRFGLSNVHVGFYTEFGSGDKNSYSCWPPTSAC